MCCVAAFALVLAALGQVRPVPAPNQTALKRPEEIRSLVDRAPLAPPELGSDILLRLVESNAITDRDWKIELLDEASQLARKAKYPLLVHPAVPLAYHSDCDIGKLYGALDQKLSGLTLQCRAIRATLALDRKKARDLFLDMPLPQFPVLTCRDAIGYDPTEYYVTLKEVFERAFGEKERREGKPFALLERAVRGISSPFQMYPAITLILDVKGLTPDQFAGLVTEYGSALKLLNTNDRAFSSTMAYDFLEKFIKLVRLCRDRDIPPSPLIDAFRSYFVRHTSGPRCAESVDPDNRGLIFSRIMESFNTDLRPLAEDVPEINKDEVKPANLGEAAKVFDYWRTPQTKSLLEHVAELLYGSEEQRAIYKKEHPPEEIHAPDLLPIEVRRKPEWEARAVAFLDELENWKKDQDVTEANYFHQVCSLHTSLIRAIPRGPMYDRVLRSHILFLRGAQIQKDSPPEWYLELDDLIHLYGASPAERAQVRDEIKRSGDDLMALYMDLNRFEKSR